MKNKIRQRESHIGFYIGSLKSELHPVFQVNLSLIVYYIKRITQSLKDYTFKYKEKHQDS